MRANGAAAVAAARSLSPSLRVAAKEAASAAVAAASVGLWLGMRKVPQIVDLVIQENILESTTHPRPS